MPTNSIPSDTRSARLVALGLAAGLTLAKASLWESPDWALTGTLAGAVGYDSNLTLSNDGEGDGFVRASPQFTMTRRNSSTDLHFDASVTGTEFFNGRQPTQTDYYARAAYAYPFAENSIPLYQSSLSWQRSSEPNQYLGRRVRHDRAVLAGEGHLSLSGKLGLRGEADVYSDDFDDPTLNHNSRWRAFAGLVYEARPRLKLSLNAGAARGRSEPNESSRFEVRSRETYLTARARGELTAKLTGNVYAGWSRVSYKGGYANRYDLPVVGADLTWGIDPRRTVVLALYSGADYAPDGQAVDTTRAFLSFTHVIVGRWQYIVRGGPNYTEFRREVRQSSDEGWEGGLEFVYVPSDRFKVGAGVSYSEQSSDARDRDYDRSTFSVESSYRF